MKGKVIAIVMCALLCATIFIGLTNVVSATPDLRAVDLARGYIGPTRYWQVVYKLYNAGPTNIVNENFSDAAWYYWGGWYKIAASEQRHNNFYLGQTTSGSFYFNWHAPPGIHWIQVWTDIYSEVPDSNYDNNYVEKLLWNWNDL